VFGDVEAEDAATVLRNWDEIKRTEPGRDGGEVFHDVPENLPSLLYARKLLRRADSRGYKHPQPDTLRDLLDTESFEAIGDLLFDCVALARDAGVDPELALRAAAHRFRKAIDE
jgi:uncharacterized protein YabN with tetrapyrrole methylase and pyrophosphatase domain